MIPVLLKANKIYFTTKTPRHQGKQQQRSSLKIQSLSWYLVPIHHKKI